MIERTAVGHRLCVWTGLDRSDKYREVAARGVKVDRNIGNGEGWKRWRREKRRDLYWGDDVDKQTTLLNGFFLLRGLVVCLWSLNSIFTGPQQV